MGPADVRTIARHGAGETQHHRSRINTDDPRTPPGSGSHRIAWTTTDIDDTVGVRYRGQVDCQACVTAPHDEHAEASHQTGHAGKARMVGVMIDLGH